MRKYRQNSEISEESKSSLEESRNRIRVASKKAAVIGSAMLLFALVVFLKTAKIMFVEDSAWQALNSHMSRPDRPSKPMRGNIYSDEESPLAISIPMYEVRMDFKASSFDGELFMASVDSLAFDLAALFPDLKKRKEYYKRALVDAYKKGKRAYKIVGREISHSEFKKVSSMPYLRQRNRNKSGLTYTRVVRRVRPYGDMAQRTIGSLKRDMDSVGITHGNSGLELAFDSVLCGKPGEDSFVFVPNRWERVTKIPPVNGMDVYTTINVAIQDITERELRNKLQEVNADWGCAVVMDVKTGAIKAISNLDRTSRDSLYVERTNHALADLLEPGSTFKSVSTLIALDEGYAQLTDTVDVGNGVYPYARGLRIIDHNAHKGGYGKITVEQSMWYSSNIGVAKTILKGFEGQNKRFLDRLNGMNIFDQIDIEIPGTAKARINQNPDTWSRSTIPWVSFGYEVQMPPIYTLRFYNAIANGGKMMEPYLVEKVSNEEDTFYENGPKVINEQIASDRAIRDIQKALRGVITHGTGRPMNSPNISIAGKTGTTQISSRSGYGASGHIVSFCGYYPAEEPKYSCIVVVARPRGVYPSGAIPGAVLVAIAEQTLATTNSILLDDMPVDTLANFNYLFAGGTGATLRMTEKVTGIEELISRKEANGNLWITQNKNDSITETKSAPITFETDTMPNLVGGGTRDALYYAELLQLRVTIHGTGCKIRRQSIPPGRRIKKGNIITLTTD